MGQPADPSAPTEWLELGSDLLTEPKQLTRERPGRSLSPRERTIGHKGPDLLGHSRVLPFSCPLLPTKAGSSDKDRGCAW